MKKPKQYTLEQTKAQGLVDLQGQQEGGTILRIGGKIYNRINMGLEHPECEGLPNKTETKQAVVTSLLKKSNKHAINELMRVINPEDLVSLFINYDEYKAIAALTEERMDSEPHNKVALAEAIVEKIVKPHGLEVEITNSLIGVNISIGIQGHNYQMN